MIGISYLDLGKYIIAYDEYKKDRKTPIYHLCRKDNELIHLGVVKWNGAWRKYCWYCEEETVFDSKCLKEIIDFLDDLNGRKSND